jgi:hypothetical protein
MDLRDIGWVGSYWDDVQDRDHGTALVDTVIKFRLTPRPESSIELYPPINSRLSANLVPTFADRGFHVVSMTDSCGRNLAFLDRSLYFFFQVAPQLYSRG